MLNAANSSCIYSIPGKQQVATTAQVNRAAVTYLTNPYSGGNRRRERRRLLEILAEKAGEWMHGAAASSDAAGAVVAAFTGSSGGKPRVLQQTQTQQSGEYCVGNHASRMGGAGFLKAVWWHGQGCCWDVASLEGAVWISNGHRCCLCCIGSL